MPRARNALLCSGVMILQHDKRQFIAFSIQSFVIY